MSFGITITHNITIGLSPAFKELGDKIIDLLAPLDTSKLKKAVAENEAGTSELRDQVNQAGQTP